MNKKIFISIIVILTVMLIIVPNVSKATASTVTLQTINVTTAVGTYKTGDKITIVATFSGNLKADSKAPTLTIKFGSKGFSYNASTGVISGNKITYEYTITDKNSGQLYLESYFGNSLQDENGNDIYVTKPAALDGNIITVNPLIWNDFSNAKYKVSINENRYADLTISNITISDSAQYKFYIKSKKETQTFDATTALSIKYDKEKKCLYSNELAQFVELNQDLYLYVVEVQHDYGTNSDVNKYIVGGVKLDRPEYPKYASVFDSTTSLCYDWFNIIMDVPWANHERKMNVKIGKITDTALLNKIKNTTSDSFSSLLSYAKATNNNIYNQQITSNIRSGNNYVNGYSSETEVINLYDKLEDKEYYFLYVTLNDENGKYYPVEGVTLAQASKYENTEKSWYMFFLGNSKFNWKDFSSTQSAIADTTTATTAIPQTGMNYIVILSVVIIAILVVTTTTIKYKKYKDIK